MDHQESYQAIFTEKCRNLEELDILRAKINSLIDESRVRIANDIGRYQKSITNRLTAKTYLYMNPYILINKLNTEATEEFLQELKSALFKGSPVDFKDNFDPKIEIATLAARIRDFLSTIGNHEKNTDRGFIRTQTKEPKISLSFDNFVKNEVEPNTIHSN